MYYICHKRRNERSRTSDLVMLPNASREMLPCARLEYYPTFLGPSFSHLPLQSKTPLSHACLPRRRMLFYVFFRFIGFIGPTAKNGLQIRVLHPIKHIEKSFFRTSLKYIFIKRSSILYVFLIFKSCVLREEIQKIEIGFSRLKCIVYVIKVHMSHKNNIF